MELHVTGDAGGDIVVLLNDEMQIVKPVYEYLKYQRQRGRALNTLKANGSDLRTFWKFLDRHRYSHDQITPRTMGEFIDFLRQGGDDAIGLYRESARTGRTINRILSTVYQFYKYCNIMLQIDNPIIMEDTNRPYNMFKGILHHARTGNRTKRSIFKVKETTRAPRLLTDEEAEIFCGALHRKRDKLLFKTLYLTGARIQEALDLEIKSVPVPCSSNLLGVFRNIKSKGKHRHLYAPMSLIREFDAFILAERSKIDTEHGYVFVSEQPQNLGNHLTYRGIYEVFKRAQDKTCIYFNFHDLRHAFLSHLVESGMDISIVRILAGHEYLSTTQKYTHLTDQYIAQSLAKYWEQSSLAGFADND